jgi:hypothetical protein
MIAEIDLEKFDFDYWTNNRIKTLLKIANEKTIEDTRTLSLYIGLSYASTHQIISELTEKSLIIKKGRTLTINPEWKTILKQ